jgi:holliday junction DNA helicase RuvA
MIEYIRGKIAEKSIDKIILEAGGIGYEVFVPSSTIAVIPELGESALLYICESSSMYSGGTTYYGFAKKEERELFDTIKSVSKIGPKSSLEIVSKINKDLPKFKKAVDDRDQKILTTYFGFTKKTAEKLILGLKDKVKNLDYSIEAGAGLKPVLTTDDSIFSDALDALVALGYKEAQVRDVVKDVVMQNGTEELSTVIKLALKNIATVTR